MRSPGTTRLTFLSRLRNREDTRGWIEFQKLYGELLYRYARRLGAAHADAEDIVQEVQMYVYRAMEWFQHASRKGCFRAYLRTAVKHAVGRLAAKQARREASLDPVVLDAVAGADPDADAKWQQEYYQHCLRWAMRAIAAEFEPATLEAFRMYVLAGRPADETAEQLGLTRDSVYQAKTRVLKRLRERIAAMDAPSDLGG